MQPYFLPYIGYWQLMNAVDKYIIYDDVNYIKGGWINRNRILLNGQPHYINLQLKGASPNKLINEIEVNQDKTFIKKTLNMVTNVYSKAPYFNNIFPLLTQIFDCDKKYLHEFITNSFFVLNNYMGISTELIISSQIKKNCSLHGQEKVIDICKSQHGDTYYNAIGGMELYSKKEFINNGINLVFLKTNDIEYAQFNNNFVNNLSILDVLMFNSRDKVLQLLNEYQLL